MFLIVSCMLSNIHYKSFRFWVNNRTFSALNKYIYIYILNQCTLASPQVFLIHLCINTLNNQGDIIHPSYFCSKLRFTKRTIYSIHSLSPSYAAIITLSNQLSTPYSFKIFHNPSLFILPHAFFKSIFLTFIHFSIAC